MESNIENPTNILERRETNPVCAFQLILIYTVKNPKLEVSKT